MQKYAVMELVETITFVSSLHYIGKIEIRDILEGLRRMLRSLRNEYDLQFAAGGNEALELMADERFDVVVFDMSMPGMDGSELFPTIKVSEVGNYRR